MSTQATVRLCLFPGKEALEGCNVNLGLHDHSPSGTADLADLFVVILNQPREGHLKHVREKPLTLAIYVLGHLL